MKDTKDNRPKARGGFTLIEVLLVVVIISILAALGIPRLGEARERAHFTAIQQDLRNLAQSQERYFVQNLRYAEDITDVDTQTSRGVILDVQSASVLGWAAVARHQSLPAEKGCAVYLGDVDAPALPDGSPHTEGEGAVQCTNS
jgi:prepilin-type N-terminal cleavage/methylation domain-containing protein